jgi:hypothetical protein
MELSATAGRASAMPWRHILSHPVRRGLAAGGEGTGGCAVYYLPRRMSYGGRA